MTELKCHKCGHVGKPISKLWCYICSNCRVILKWKEAEIAREALEKSK